MCSLFSFVSVGVFLFIQIVSAGSLNPIVIKGNAFFDSVTNKRFYIRGVDYQVFVSISLCRCLTHVCV